MGPYSSASHISTLNTSARTRYPHLERSDGIPLHLTLLDLECLLLRSTSPDLEVCKSLPHLISRQEGGRHVCQGSSLAYLHPTLCDGHGAVPPQACTMRQCSLPHLIPSREEIGTTPLLVYLERLGRPFTLCARSTPRWHIFTPLDLDNTLYIPSYPT